MRPTSQRDATLLEVLIDGFAEEALRWKGPPSRLERGVRQIAAWPDLELRQVGRGLMVRVRAPNFSWWHEPGTWAGDPMGPIEGWVESDGKADD
jgi:hypothetical protein